ncbi:MAG TPA: DUF4810 domain-containing protein [Candidatus Paceibacterota bacterium]|nr:DUF4810 domain-containing protein [Candidatus Paceibacterota bacterium]
MKFIPLVLVVLAGLLTGCGTPTIYSWGRYEDMVYKTYSEPGKLSPDDQILKMNEDLEKAKSRNKPVHPGFYAHLGYLYAQTGKLDQARQALEAEKAQFPESTVFVDHLLANLERK